MQPRFWKLSQGGDDFIEQDVLMSIEQRLVFVHGKTRAKGEASVSQGEDFINAPIGDYFYLTYGNKGVYIIGQFTGPPNFLCAHGKGWVDRPFRLIRAATAVKSYTGPDKWWAPNNNSTFTRVPDHALQLFEDSILWPHFGIRLADFEIDVEA
jgi:hypothetical protein